ncbi:MAG: hypothetical protein NTV11_13050 [Rhodocyclales bacterium]|nr:hypothetical protein [Rhodocyclales bacterium]
MSKRITIDPITRIEGHLRIDVDVDGGRVKKAWSSGQMWRGVELILLGRDPRDAPAHLRRVHHGACHHLGAGGGKRPEDGNPAECPVHPQPDHPGAFGA